MKIENKKYYVLIKNMLKDYKGTVYLTGGAVIDCLNGVKPKDYDVFCHSSGFEDFLVSIGFEYMYSSKTATTFIHKINQLTIQILKKI